jgi:hypothetical protein
MSSAIIVSALFRMIIIFCLFFSFIVFCLIVWWVRIMHSQFVGLVSSWFCLVWF